jgi:hypothetical protein
MSCGFLFFLIKFKKSKLIKKNINKYITFVSNCGWKTTLKPLHISKVGSEEFFIRKAYSSFD